MELHSSWFKFSVTNRIIEVLRIALWHRDLLFYLPFRWKQKLGLWNWGYCFSCHYKKPFPTTFLFPTSEVIEQIAISISSKSEVKEKTKPSKEIDPGAPMEFYNQTHILDTSILSKSPLKCKNLICQHVYIISSITVQAVALCGDTGLETPSTVKWEDVDWLEFTLGRIVSDSSAIRLLTLIPDTLSLHWD